MRTAPSRAGDYPADSNFAASAALTGQAPLSMEVSAIRHLGAAGAHGRSPLLRLQSDERLVSLVRRGNHHAFEALVSRYHSRLLAFCRHMLSSREDAEDVLQEVFAAAFNAMLADERPINVRPWLYRIARNRSLNHLRRTQAVGVDSMDTHFAEHGLTTADKAHRREDFRLLIADVQELPETQRTALLLREIDALSYEQIAEAMENTVPSVKSLLVRARVGLAEAAEARLLDCDVVRFELGEVAEGLKRMSPPVRRHVRTCEQCSLFRRQLNDTNRKLAALLPVGPLLILKKTLLAQLGTAAAASGGSAVAGSAAGGALQLTFNAAAGKAAAGLAAAASVTAGAVEAKHVAIDRGGRPAVVATASAPSPAPASAPAPAEASGASTTTELVPSAPRLDPFGAPGAPAAGEADDKPGAADERADAPAPEQAEDATGTGDEPDAATADGEEAADVPVLPDTPVLAVAPADSLGGPLTTPLAGAPGVSPTPTGAPASIEGVVRPSEAALGTPVTGVVRPDSIDKQPQPIVEAVPPAAVSAPVAGPAEPIAAPEVPSAPPVEAQAPPELPLDLVPVPVPDLPEVLEPILPAIEPESVPAPTGDAPGAEADPASPPAA